MELAGGLAVGLFSGVVEYEWCILLKLIANKINQIYIHV
jgi:hypothetical protein